MAADAIHPDSRHRVLCLVAVLRLPGMVAGLWPGWTAPLRRNHRRIAGNSDDDLRIPRGRLLDAAIRSHGQADAGIAFSIVPWSGILFFAVVFAIGIAMVRRPEVHKRLMLLAGISILDAAVARWFLTFLAPPGPPGPPPVPVTIAPAVVASLLLVVAMVRDWRTDGRVHPVYIYGTLALLAVKVLNWPISETAAWHSFAGGILALAQ